MIVDVSGSHICKHWEICFYYFVVQSFSHVWLFATPWTPAFQAPLTFTISQSLFKLMSIELTRPSNLSSSVAPFSSWLQNFPALGSFPRSHSFTSDGQSIGVPASSSVLPMNIQDWFPLWLTGLISLQTKELSWVFPNTTVKKSINSLVLNLIYGPTLASIHDY